MQSSNCQYCGTNCGAKPFVYNWKIQNLQLNSYQKFIKSPEFSTTDEKDDMWEIIFYLDSGYVNATKKYQTFDFGLKLVDSKYINIQVSFKITIIENDESYVPRTFIKFRKFCANTKKFCTARVKDIKDNIISYFNNKYYVRSEIIICKAQKNCIPNLYPNMRVLDKHLSEDISSLHLNESFSDVCLDADGVKFRVHKNILAARSTVFYAMFNINMKEKQENVIKISEITPEIMKEMIRYIYTDQVENINAHAIELLKAAEMYDLSGLKVLCENSIFKTFTADNVMELFELASTYNAENLKKMALNFIKNNIEDVTKTPNFLNFRGSHSVLIEIIKSFLT